MEEDRAFWAWIGMILWGFRRYEGFFGGKTRGEMDLGGVRKGEWEWLRGDFGSFDADFESFVGLDGTI